MPKENEVALWGIRDRVPARLPKANGLGNLDDLRCDFSARSQWAMLQEFKKRLHARSLSKVSLVTYFIALICQRLLQISVGNVAPMRTKN